MRTYKIEVVEDALAVYWVEAESAQAARERLERGEWDSWRDLGHDNMDIISVEEEM